jgi:serine/threonine protein kinase
MPVPTRVLDRYEIIRPLGQGGFGSTWLGQDLQLDRPVVIKVLRARGDEALKAYELFQREAAVLRELRHPGIPAIHASFRAPWDGTEAAMLVMEYVEGRSIEAMIADRRHFDTEDVVNLFVEALGLLDYLHTRVPPVLHRDIKPANLIVRNEGSLAFVDFGAVRNVFHTAVESGSTIVGTYGYMPYEQYMGQASPASDLYALAATFLHLLTGRMPADFLSGEGRIVVPPDLSCGEPFRGVLARMLSPAPSDRFQSAKAARAALFGGGTASTAPVASTAAAVGIAPAALTTWEPTPRAFHGATRDRYSTVAYNLWQLIDPESKHPKPTLLDRGLVTFFSVLTIGILPMIVLSRVRSRRSRLKPFFINGLPARAAVLEMARETLEFGGKLVRVRYEFEADGARRRGSDWVLPSIADKWQIGDAIEVLYLPERDYDSVIVSTT